MRKRTNRDTKIFAALDRRTDQTRLIFTVKRQGILRAQLIGKACQYYIVPRKRHCNKLVMRSGFRRDHADLVGHDTGICQGGGLGFGNRCDRLWRGDISGNRGIGLALRVKGAFVAKRGTAIIGSELVLCACDFDRGNGRFVMYHRARRQIGFDNHGRCAGTGFGL